MTLKLSKDVPSPEVILSEMPREKAIELLRDLIHWEYTFITPDEKIAITMAMCALIAEELNLVR